MKKCKICEEKKDEKEFYERHAKCIQCFSILRKKRTKEYYRQNSEVIKEKSKKRYKKNRKKILKKQEEKYAFENNC